MHSEVIRRSLKTWRTRVLSETQEEFAARLGVAQATVSSWERSKNPKAPGPKQRRHIAAVLGVRVDQIIWPDEESSEGKDNAAKAA